jgi:hypothetical protein
LPRANSQFPSGLAHSAIVAAVPNPLPSSSEMRIQENPSTYHFIQAFLFANLFCFANNEPMEQKMLSRSLNIGKIEYNLKGDEELLSTEKPKL